MIHKLPCACAHFYIGNNTKAFTQKKMLVHDIYIFFFYKDADALENWKMHQNWEIYYLMGMYCMLCYIVDMLYISISISYISMYYIC